MDDKNEILDLIVSLTKGVQDKDNELKCHYGGDDYKLGACTYLLGQVLRQYSKNNGRIYVSKKAYEKWKSLTKDEMIKRWYTNGVNCDGPTFENGGKQTLYLYKGNSNKPEPIEFKKGDKFAYRQVFHDEHIIPIASIIEDLKNLDDPSYENVGKVLDNICICRILKSEDRNIKNKNARYKCLIRTYDESYKVTKNEEPIELINWEKVEADYKSSHRCDNGCDSCKLNKRFVQSRKHKKSEATMLEDAQDQV